MILSRSIVYGNIGFFLHERERKVKEHFDTEQINRLWEYRLHLDGEFYSLLNFFLVFESILLGVVGILYSKLSLTIALIKGITLLGLIITIVWAYIQARHKYILDILGASAKETIPEYKSFLETLAKGRWPFSSMWLLSYMIPALIGLIWIVLLFFL